MVELFDKIGRALMQAFGCYSPSPDVSQALGIAVLFEIVSLVIILILMIIVFIVALRHRKW